MDKIYEDFTTKMLPTIQEGLVITKDYFIDLFGRYVTYLLVTDIIGLILSVLALVVGLCILRLAIKKGVANDWLGGMEIPLFFISAFLILVGFIVSVEKTFDVVKDVYIPEVRVYEELKPLFTNQTTNTN